jgi:hypothetical protein
MDYFPEVQEGACNVLSLFRSESRRLPSVEEAVLYRIKDYKTHGLPIQWGKSIVTRDCFVRYPDGSAAVALNPVQFRNLQPIDDLIDGGISLPDDYCEEGWRRFSKDEAEKHFVFEMKREEAYNNPVWTALIPDDIIRRKAINKAIHYSEDSTRLGAWPHKPAAVPTMLPILLCSDVYGWSLHSIAADHYNPTITLLGVTHFTSRLHEEIKRAP